MDSIAAGQAGLAGWRKKIADGIADPVASRTPLGSEQVRALVGGAFFLLSVYYVIGTLRRLRAGGGSG